MKYLSEFRDPALVDSLLKEIRRVTKRPWVIMEVCGGQTHSIVRNGLNQLLPGEIELVHGPGCPVCVTPVEVLDKAIAIASEPDVILVSFGDMLRVPGSQKDLSVAKSEGSDVRTVYSPLDALNLARQHPERKVVFLAVGFETTVPTSAMAVWQARREGVKNFSLLVAHVRVPPAMRLLLRSPQNRVQGYLAAGHVCTVMGWHEYDPIADEFRVPIVVTGFEPADILQGVLMTIRQLEQGRAEVENQYSRLVRREGNPSAQNLIHQVFEPCDRQWRGIGVIPESGFRLKPEFREHDAELCFSVQDIQAVESPDCLSGIILQGLKKPFECPAFGATCTPQTPLGATMVSSEGACAAYYRYSRQAGVRKD